MRNEVMKKVFLGRFKMIQERKATVLIVEDIQDLRELLADRFKRQGYSVLTAVDGAEGFELIKTSRVDIVISDVQMPNVSGPEMLAKIKSSKVALPLFIFMTGYSPIPHQDLIQMGAAAVFTKPFNEELIFKAIDKVWER
jgi:DNA-binding NtrC family response regulator